MGFFNKFYKFIYLGLAIFAILLILIILFAPAYKRYYLVYDKNARFFYNPSNHICMQANHLCPRKNETSFWYMIVFLMLFLCIPILITCSVLNFLTTKLGPLAALVVNGATGLCALLVILSMPLGYVTRNNISYAHFNIKMGPTFYLGYFEFFIITGMMVMSFFTTFLSRFCV